MKRTKEWWDRLEPWERSNLVYFERYADRGGPSAYYPDDCSECGVCGLPCFGYGPCKSCLDEAIRIIKKADKGE